MRDRPPRDSIEGRAYRRVRKKLFFYKHAAVFAAVNAAFYAYAELMGHPHRGFGMFWGWGLGLLIHGIVTFVSLQGEGMRERMIREEIERMRRDRSQEK